MIKTTNINTIFLYNNNIMDNIFENYKNYGETYSLIKMIKTYLHTDIKKAYLLSDLLLSHIIKKINNGNILNENIDICDILDIFEKINIKSRDIAILYELAINSNKSIKYKLKLAKIYSNNEYNCINLKKSFDLYLSIYNDIDISKEINDMEDNLKYCLLKMFSIINEKNDYIKKLEFDNNNALNKICELQNDLNNEISNRKKIKIINEYL